MEISNHEINGFKYCDKHAYYDEVNKCSKLMTQLEPMIKIKFTDEQILNILFDERSCKEVSKIFNVSESTISRIRRENRLSENPIVKPINDNKT